MLFRSRYTSRITPARMVKSSLAISRNQSCTKSFEFPKDTSVAVDVLCSRKLHFIRPGLQPQLWGLYRSVEVQEAGWPAAIRAAALQRCAPSRRTPKRATRTDRAWYDAGRSAAGLPDKTPTGPRPIGSISFSKLSTP